jgi:hypothetical protein
MSLLSFCSSRVPLPVALAAPALAFGALHPSFLDRCVFILQQAV